MAIGLLGRKVGMTRIFTEDGTSVPISVVQVVPNRVSQIKTKENDGYDAVQLTGGSRKPNKICKPLAGHFAKTAIEAGDLICEFPINIADSNITTGKVLTVADVFSNGQYVDVTASSKGKGFAGTVKRYNFRMQNSTHGNSRAHRVPGSTGQNQTPGKVFKGKKMAGHMGDKKCTIQSLELIRVDAEANLLLIRGAIPGCPGARVVVKPAIKCHAKR